MTPQPDNRTEQRKQLDEQIAAEPKLPFPELPADLRPEPLEKHLKPKGERPS